MQLKKHAVAINEFVDSIKFTNGLVEEIPLELRKYFFNIHQCYLDGVSVFCGNKLSFWADGEKVFEVPTSYYYRSDLKKIIMGALVPWRYWEKKFKLNEVKK